MGSYRKRMIWPSIFGDAHIQRLSLVGFKLMIAHICAADDQGRGAEGVGDWKAFAFQQDATVSDREITAALVELWTPKAGKGCALVEPYEVDGAVFWYLPRWDRYQSINKPTASRLPDPAGCVRPSVLAGERLILATIRSDLKSILDALQVLDRLDIRDNLNSLAMVVGTMDGGEDDRIS